MKAAYIGILTDGSTSRMRAETLREITPDWSWDWLDTDVPLNSTSRMWRSMAYRLQTGFGVTKINRAVTEFILDRQLDLVWIDKAIFLTRDTVESLRARSRKLVHFTPDTAFHANRSRHFDRTIGMFDLLITTKSFEVNEYWRRVDRARVCLTTQGFDPRVHYPRVSDNLRAREVVFVGLAEPNRESIVGSLLESGIPVRLAGQGWEKFLRRHRENSLLNFVGDSIFGDDYARLLSTCWIGLGLLSKRFPELHTTRTFEIPACGTILATEKTRETSTLFDDSQALFFETEHDLAGRVTEFFESNLSRLASLASAGRERVISDGRDYASILAGILRSPLLN